MGDDRLKALLALSDMELCRPLWEWLPDQRRDVIRARERRRFARWVPESPEDVYQPSEAHTAVLEFAPTE